MRRVVTVLGFGAVGQACVAALAGSGHKVIVAQRKRPTALPPEVEFRSCDVLDSASVTSAVRGSRQVVLAIGFPYRTAQWQQCWPQAMTHVLEACRQEQARLVFIDNLYMYGPQFEPLREDMPLTRRGGKPAVRADVTRLWLAAAQAGHVKVTALRAPDFYGPGVRLSHLGDTSLAALAAGRRAWLLVPPDTPHDFAYVPDVARAAVALLEAPDECYGQAWHVPCAPTRTPRAILALGAAALGHPLRLSSIPLGLSRLLGVASPFMREFAEMQFTFDRPYRVDASKFARQFWSDPTPFETGAPLAARSFLPVP